MNQVEITCILCRNTSVVASRKISAFPLATEKKSIHITHIYILKKTPKKKADNKY